MDEKNKETQKGQDELLELGSDLSKGSQGNIKGADTYNNQSHCDQQGIGQGMTLAFFVYIGAKGVAQNAECHAKQGALQNITHLFDLPACFAD